MRIADFNEDNAAYRVVSYDPDKLRSAIKKGTDRDETSFGEADVYATDNIGKALEYIHPDRDNMVLVYDKNKMRKIGLYGYNLTSGDALVAIIIIPKDISSQLYGGRK